MTRQTQEKEMQDWISVLCCPDDEWLKKFSEGWPENGILLIEKAAEDYYNLIRRPQYKFSPPVGLTNDFSRLSPEEKSPWYIFASSVPLKLISLGLFIHPVKDFCRTCLIPYDSFEKLAENDYKKIFLPQKKGGSINVPFRLLPEKERRFYIELNYLIPPVLKSAGFELVRPEEVTEISSALIKKIAKAIHSRYLHDITRRDPGSEKKPHVSWFYTGADAESFSNVRFEDLPVSSRSAVFQCYR